jgi:hypothetical protein
LSSCFARSFVRPLAEPFFHSGPHDGRDSSLSVCQNGNAFNLAGRVIAALREAGVPQDEIDAFWEEASSKDYDHLRRTCMEWVDVS